MYKRQELQSSLYILYVDFEKAFDSVMRKKMWKAMKELDVYKRQQKKGFSKFFQKDSFP